jgi:hypothetical protein
MKRDIDLIRRILLDFENIPAGSAPASWVYEGYDEETVREHLVLLIESKLVKGQVVAALGCPEFPIPEKISWEGYDFLDASRDESLWTKAKSKFLNGTASFTF